MHTWTLDPSPANSPLWYWVSSCDLGGRSMLSTYFWADQISLSACTLPYAKQTIFCPKLQDIIFPGTLGYQLLLLLQVLHCTQLLSAGTKPDTVMRTRKACPYRDREPAKLLHVSNSTNSVNGNLSLQFHFRKCGVSQSWIYARHCNKTNTATEASVGELHPVISIW